MSISLDEVDRIAKLSRLEFNDAEKQKLQVELSSILSYVDQIQKISGQAEPVLFDDPESLNRLRDDVAQKSPNPEQFLSQAPGRQGKFIKVKSILE